MKILTRGKHMNRYTDAVDAAQSAFLAKRWTQPVKIFGYIVIGMAVLSVAGSLIGGAASIGQTGGASGLLVMVSGLVLGALIFLQGALVLMLAYYVQMRSEEVTMRAKAMLASDE
jgi:hypothetical protein